MELIAFEIMVELSNSDFEKLTEMVNNELSINLNKPNKPLLIQHHTIEDIQKYLNDMIIYDEKIKEYHYNNNQLLIQKELIKNELKDYLCQSFLTNIDKDNWNRIYYYCQENSDSYNIMNKLIEINDLFSPH